jgi:hypothetical protein
VEFQSFKFNIKILTQTKARGTFTIMNIGFDLDKVFINTPPFIPKDIIEKLYKKRDNGVLLYRIPGKPEQIVRRLSHLPLLRPAIKDNLDFLRSIPKDKNKLYLISSRFKFLEDSTEKIIKKYNFDKIFNAMFFNFSNEQPHIFKNRIIRNLKLDYYIDDDLSLINYVAKNNPNTTFFWLTTHAVKKSQSNIHPITKLLDLNKRIHSKPKGKKL